MEHRRIPKIILTSIHSLSQRIPRHDTSQELEGESGILDDLDMCRCVTSRKHLLETCLMKLVEALK